MSTKYCNGCKINLPVTLFGHFHDKMGRRYLQPRCVKCHNEQKQRWYQRNPEAARSAQLTKYYGIDSDEYERLLTEQGGRCKICNSDKPGRKTNKFFSVDHNHTTGKVRGLLCSKCNSAIGLMQDSSAILRKAAEYLDQHNEGDSNEEGNQPDAEGCGCSQVSA